MIIGVPKEIKQNENRVGLLPVGVQELKKHGHTVLVETNAGVGSGFDNDSYKKVGAKIISSAKEIYKKSDMIIKVKEPIKVEYGLIKKDQILFTYLHFAASEELTLALIKSKAVCIAYETVQKSDGSLPLLIPMSEVAGRMAPQEGAKYLERTSGGRGVLLAGVPGTIPAEVVIIGGGVVGTNAAKIAAGLGAHVTILDSNLQRLRYLDDIMPKNVSTRMSNQHNIQECVIAADLVIGAVLIPGAKAPKLVTRELLKKMKKGSVVIDVAVDQGGCIETCKPTTHENPTYVVEGVIHYCVANMPGAVPYTSTVALTNATLPYAVEIANNGWKKAAKNNPEISSGINMIDGHVTYKGVSDAWNLKFSPIENFLK
ncbi:MAG: alanine dehydrogenase [Ignavibacteria bacterium]|nr:alanine dehydrogenase [Bacteroidota bacterium]MSQ45632.1 alanine dehydrogenase [Ignavibacteria bacterium]